MNRYCLFVFTLLLSLFIFSSCTKTETITKVETKTDTLQVAAKDTTFAMDVAGWDFIAYPVFLPSGASTYINTAEGIKFFAQLPRAGVRLQVKNEVGFKDKTLLYKWKATGGGQFTDIVLSVKYVPTTGDGDPAIQGVDLEKYSVIQTYNGTILVQPDTWYYTRVSAQKGTNNYQVVTATGNYDNRGGIQVATKTIPIYTKHGYPAIRLGDPYAGSAANVVLGECRIADN